MTFLKDTKQLYVLVLVQWKFSLVEKLLALVIFNQISNIIHCLDLSLSYYSKEPRFSELEERRLHSVEMYYVSTGTPMCYKSDQTLRKGANHAQSLHILLHIAQILRTEKMHV